MKPTVILSTLALALAVAPAASAEETKFVLSGGLIFNQGNTLDLTAKRAGGFNLEAGVLFSPQDFGAQILVYGGNLRIPGGTPSAEQPTYNMNSPHFGFELVYRPWDKLSALSINAGPSFHIWQVEQNGVPAATASMGNQNLKLGWRTGVGYDFDKCWSLSLNYTFTEWRSDYNQSYQSGLNPSRPSYITLMGSYRF